MCNDNTTFETVKVGDRVWSITYGWATVTEVFKDKFEVQNDNGSTSMFNNDGTFHRMTSLFTKTNRCLFWDEIKFEIPKKPSKKVRKTVSIAVALHTQDNILCATVHLPRIADKIIDKPTKVYGIVHEYEVIE